MINGILISQSGRRWSICQDPWGDVIPALLQTTNQGQIFLLNRESGTPIASGEERPVPTHGAAPGEPVPT
jgi:glucose dehydrogenase